MVTGSKQMDKSLNCSAVGTASRLPRVHDYWGSALLMVVDLLVRNVSICVWLRGTAVKCWVSRHDPKPAGLL